MTHNVLIDGVNIRERYKVLLAEGAYGPILEWPEAKPVRENVWQESDGSEPDLSQLLLSSRTLGVPFILKGDATEISSFYQFLASKPKHTFQFSALGVSVTLRLVSMPSLKYAISFQAMKVQFASDIPMEGYSYAVPVSSLTANYDFVIDGLPFSDYGMRILRGTVDNVAKSPAVKPLLTRSVSTKDGSSYDENPVLNDPDSQLPASDYETIGNSVEGVSGTWKRSKEVGDVTVSRKEMTLSILLRTPTVAAGLRNYYALLHDLVAQDNTVLDVTEKCKRVLYCAINNTYYDCCYKSQKVVDCLCRDGLFWMEFSLTLSVVREFMMKRVLQTENNRIVITESGYAILV